jgi:hypothetical protein
MTNPNVFINKYENFIPPLYLDLGFFAAVAA